jgi:hypothetical protein
MARSGLAAEAFKRYDVNNDGMMDVSLPVQNIKYTFFFGSGCVPSYLPVHFCISLLFFQVREIRNAMKDLQVTLSDANLLKLQREMDKNQVSLLFMLLSSSD